MQKPDRNELGNFGVPTGATIVLVCFFLPWIALGGMSGLEVISCDADTAEFILYNFGLEAPDPTFFVKIILFVPIVALIVLFAELVVPPGVKGRMAVNICLSAASGMLTVMLAFLGVHFSDMLSYGFWGALTGALFISVGVTFNVLRGE